MWEAGTREFLVFLLKKKKDYDDYQNSSQLIFNVQKQNTSLSISSVTYISYADIPVIERYILKQNWLLRLLKMANFPRKLVEHFLSQQCCLCVSRCYLNINKCYLQELMRIFNN